MIFPADLDDLHRQKLLLSAKSARETKTIEHWQICPALFSNECVTAKRYIDHTDWGNRYIPD